MPRRDGWGKEIDDRPRLVGQSPMVKKAGITVYRTYTKLGTHDYFKTAPLGQNKDGLIE
jgi:hypothetical protein